MVAPSETSWDFVTPLARWAERSVPHVAAVVVLVVGGVVASWLASKLATWLCRRAGLEKLGQRFGVERALAGVGLRRGMSEIVGLLVGLATLCLFLLSAAEVAGLNQLADAIDRALAFLPSLAAALATLIVSLALGGVLRRAIAAKGKERGLERPEGVANSIYYAVVVVGALMAVEQLGLDAELVHKLVLVVTALAAAGVALAFGLGNVEVLRGMSASQYLRRLASPGDELVLEQLGIDGVVLRYSGICVVLRGEDGEHVVPCAQILGSAFRVRSVVRPPAEDSE